MYMNHSAWRGVRTCVSDSWNLLEYFHSSLFLSLSFYWSLFFPFPFHRIGLGQHQLHTSRQKKKESANTDETSARIGLILLSFWPIYTDFNRFSWNVYADYEICRVTSRRLTVQKIDSFRFRFTDCTGYAFYLIDLIRSFTDTLFSNDPLWSKRSNPKTQVTVLLEWSKLVLRFLRDVVVFISKPFKVSKCFDAVKSYYLASK